MKPWLHIIPVAGTVAAETATGGRDALKSRVAALIPPDQIEWMLANRTLSVQEGYDPQPIAHLYVPGTGCQWLLSEIDPDLDIAFGLCDLGLGYPELGYVSLYEILTVTPQLVWNNSLHSQVVRERLSVYARWAYRAQRIVLREDWV